MTKSAIIEEKSEVVYDKLQLHSTKRKGVVHPIPCGDI